ncbi:hypothetical protein K470DRAFT_90982 [Piedraia hortae CBS 480.64]|uniref:Uncharacterized protein n=1 Tax=Piedraia hortae CBS 480.64 TaxID=1314780 RepID=A0A6A7BXV8_9PEZI|nr:hypothetical protein K470DRAFT_90982 [Piedraia hortae CBS 480.64]
MLPDLSPTSSLSRRNANGLVTMPHPAWQRCRALMTRAISCIWMTVCVCLLAPAKGFPPRTEFSGLVARTGQAILVDPCHCTSRSPACSQQRLYPAHSIAMCALHKRANSVGNGPSAFRKLTIISACLFQAIFYYVVVMHCLGWARKLAIHAFCCLILLRIVWQIKQSAHERLLVELYYSRVRMRHVPLLETPISIFCDVVHGGSYGVLTADIERHRLLIGVCVLCSNTLPASCI